MSDPRRETIFNGARSDVNFQRFCYPGDSYSINASPSLQKSTTTPTSNAQNRAKAPRTAPPVPPRPNENVSHSRYPTMPYGYGMPYGMGFGSRNLPYTPYGNFGMYGSRPTYSNGYGGADPENIFIRMAEESSRPAFQSIESMVNAVGSISMMLESTYFAVYSSYRAVLGVVDQFSRLRNHLAYVMSTLAVIRTLQWILRRFLHFLGLQKNKGPEEAAWSAASAAIAKKDSFSKNADNQTAWPIFMFMGLVFGAPWLIFRIFSRMAAKKAREILQSQDVDQRRVVAYYDFQAGRPGELSVIAGQQLYLAPKNLQPKVPGWSLICDEHQKTGLVPTTYLRRVQQRMSSTPPVNVNSAATSELPVSSENKDSVAANIASNSSSEPVMEPCIEPTINDTYKIQVAGNSFS